MSRPGPERRAQARRPRPHRVHIRGPLTARARRSISPSAAGWDTGRATPGPRPRPTATWVRRNPRLRTQGRRPPHARSSLRRPDHAPTAGCDRQTSPRQARSVPRHRRPSPSWFQASDSPPSSRGQSLPQSDSPRASPTAASLGSALTSAGLGGVVGGRGPAAAAALLPRLGGRS